jgi:hypothetical protein
MRNGLSHAPDDKQIMPRHSKRSGHKKASKRIRGGFAPNEALVDLAEKKYQREVAPAKQQWYNAERTAQQKVREVMEYNKRNMDAALVSFCEVPLKAIRQATHAYDFETFKPKFDCANFPDRVQKQFLNDKMQQTLMIAPACKQYYNFTGAPTSCEMNAEVNPFRGQAVVPRAIGYPAAYEAAPPAFRSPRRSQVAPAPPEPPVVSARGGDPIEALARARTLLDKAGAGNPFGDARIPTRVPQVSIPDAVTSAAEARRALEKKQAEDAQRAQAEARAAQAAKYAALKEAKVQAEAAARRQNQIREYQAEAAARYAQSKQAADTVSVVNDEDRPPPPPTRPAPPPPAGSQFTQNVERLQEFASAAALRQADQAARAASRAARAAIPILPAGAQAPVLPGGADSNLGGGRKARRAKSRSKKSRRTSKRRSAGRKRSVVRRR